MRASATGVVHISEPMSEGAEEPFLKGAGAEPSAQGSWLATAAVRAF